MATRTDRLRPASITLQCTTRCPCAPTGLTDEKPHVRFAVQLLFVHLAQHFSGGNHVKQTDDYPGVLPAQVFHGVSRIAHETLPGDYFDAVLLASGFDVFNRLRITKLVYVNEKTPVPYAAKTPFIQKLPFSFRPKMFESFSFFVQK